MQSFTDAEGRRWSIEIDFDARSRVKAETGVDFLNLSCFERLADLVTLGDVLGSVCREQLERRRVSEREFAGGLKGDAFERARVALEAELCDFFPNGKHQTRVLAEATGRLKKMNVRTPTRWTWSEPSGVWPACSASTPGN